MGGDAIQNPKEYVAGRDMTMIAILAQAAPGDLERRKIKYGLARVLC